MRDLLNAQQDESNVEVDRLAKADDSDKKERGTWYYNPQCITPGGYYEEWSNSMRNEKYVKFHPNAYGKTIKMACRDDAEMPSMRDHQPNPQEAPRRGARVRMMTGETKIADDAAAARKQRDAVADDLYCSKLTKSQIKLPHNQICEKLR